MSLTRRDVLAAFLGAPFAALACRERVPALPPGELAGASHEIGHLLRGGALPPPAQWSSHEVVIVGGGIAGLAAYWRLRAAGVRDVVVLELEPELGGTSRSTASYPWGAHYVIAPSPANRVLARLLEEMHVTENGAVREEFLVRDPEERLFYRGRWYEGLYLHAGATPEDHRQLQAFEKEIARWSAWRDTRGRRAFEIPMALGSDDAEVTALDRISMAAWLDQYRLTSSRLRWLVDYACRDDYGTTLETTSAWAGVFYFASRDQRPVITWPEGNGRIVQFLSRELIPHKNLVAVHVTPSGEVIAARKNFTWGVRARRVIFAAPQFVAQYAIPTRTASRDFTYGSWMVANLTLRDRPRSHGFPLAWDNVLYESPSLGYVAATHQRGVDHGRTVLTYYYPLTAPDARRHLLQTGRDAWADVALSDLSRAHPEIRELTERVDVMRWGHAMVSPTPGFVWSESRRRASEPHGVIHFANTDLSGVALCEEALYHGVRAAEEALAGLEMPVATWI